MHYIIWRTLHILSLFNIWHKTDRQPLKNWYFWIVVLKTLENPLDSKEIKPINGKGNQPWLFIGRTDAEAEAPDAKPTHQKRPWCWQRLRVAEEGDDRGWDGWMASLTQWTWVQANSGRYWRTGKPGMLQSMGSQRVGHRWATELNWFQVCNCKVLVYSELCNHHHN